MTEEHLETLRLLGLTTVQGKVYLAITRTQNATIKEIARLSHVARPDTYRVIHYLENRSLVEKQIAAPAEYIAVPLCECVKILSQNRNRENFEIEKRVAKLLKTQTKKTQGEDAKESNFFLVPRSRAFARIEQAIDRLQESFDVILSLDRFTWGLNFLSNVDKKALARKVKFRFIVEKEENSARYLAIPRLNTFVKNPLCSIRFVGPNLRVNLAIYDGKEVSIAENPEEKLNRSALLWSNNKALLALSKGYFEQAWLTAKNSYEN